MPKNSMLGLSIGPLPMGMPRWPHHRLCDDGEQAADAGGGEFLGKGKVTREGEGGEIRTNISAKSKDAVGRR